MSQQIDNEKPLNEKVINEIECENNKEICQMNLQLLSLKENFTNEEYFNVLTQFKSYLIKFKYIEEISNESDLLSNTPPQNQHFKNLLIFRDISLNTSHSQDFLKLCTFLNLNISIYSFFSFLSLPLSNSPFRFKFEIFHDYESFLFILTDYFSKTPQISHPFISIASTQNTFTLYPVFSLLLHFLNKDNNLEEASSLINILISSNIEISTCAINSYIDSLCKSKQLENAHNIFQQLCDYIPNKLFPKNKYIFNKYILGYGVNIVTYGTFIKWLCKNNNMDLALYYYQYLSDKDYLKDEIIYNLILDGCSKKGDLVMIRDIYYEMIKKEIKPTIITFNIIIDAYIRAGDIESAWKIFDDLIKNEIQPDNFTLSTLFRGIRTEQHKKYLIRAFELLNNFTNDKIDIILINVLLDSCISLKDSKLMIELFSKVINFHFKSIQPDLVTYNTYINGCAQMDLYNDVQIAIDNLFSKNSNIKPNDVTFNTLINLYIKSKNMKKVWNIISQMQTYNIKPDNFTYSTIIKGINKHTNLMNCDNDENQQFPLEIDNDKELNLAMNLFENVRNISKPDEILYNCIMDACLRFKKVDKALELYENMINEGVKPSSITCGIVIKAYGMKRDINKALSIYEQMKKENIKITSITIGCLMNACIENNKTNYVFQIYDELKQNQFQMNTILYTTIIKAYTKEKNLTKAIEVLNTMKSQPHNDNYNNSLPNNITYNTIIDCCLKCNEIDLADNYFNEMCSITNIQPDLITFSTLIKGAIFHKHFNKAMSYYNKLLAMKIRPDDVFLNTLLDGCDKMHKYKQAILIYETITSLNIEPSMLSYSIMLKILGKLNKFEYSTTIFNKAKQNKKNINLIMFTCYIKTCLYNKHVEEAMISFKEMINQFEIKPDVKAYITIINGIYWNEENDNDYSDFLYEMAKRSINDGCLLDKKIYINVLKYIKRFKWFNKSKELGEFLERNNVFDSKKKNSNNVKYKEQELNINSKEYIPIKQRDKISIQSTKENINKQSCFIERIPFNSLWERNNYNNSNNTLANNNSHRTSNQNFKYNHTFYRKNTTNTNSNIFTTNSNIYNDNV